jgi:hypothetical protein
MKSVTVILALAAALATSAVQATVINNAQNSDVTLDASGARRPATTFVFAEGDHSADLQVAGSEFNRFFANIVRDTNWQTQMEMTNPTGQPTTATATNTEMSFTFSMATGANGTWFLTGLNDNMRPRDVVLVLTNNDGTSAYLFDHTTFLKNEGMGGTWSVNWGEDGTPSALTKASIYMRESTDTIGGGGDSDVPEPASMAVMLAGIGLMGLTRRKRSR